jgi:DNA-binding MarR family transcriptional regulator
MPVSYHGKRVKADHIDRIVAQWRQERPDLDFAPLGVLGRLFRAAELADVALTAALADESLQPGWFDVLAVLRRSGPPYELSPTELLHSMMLSSGGLTKRLDRLTEAGLIQRRPDPDDRRGSLARLTRKGEALIDRAIAKHVENEAQLLGVLTPAERRAFDTLLRRLLAGLEP